MVVEIGVGVAARAVRGTRRDSDGDAIDTLRLATEPSTTVHDPALPRMQASARPWTGPLRPNANAPRGTSFRAARESTSPDYGQIASAVPLYEPVQFEPPPPRAPPTTNGFQHSGVPA